MSNEEIIRYLDGVEADLRRLEHRVYRVRAALRERVDPFHRRKDLGYWEVASPSPATGEPTP